MDFSERRLILRFAGILGILQATAWSLMAIIAIAMFYDQPQFENEKPDMSYSRFISLAIYGRFLYKPDYDIKSDMVIGAREFHVFMWFYLVFDLFWLFQSYGLYSASKTSHIPSKKLMSKMKIWPIVTIVICLLDFIFVCFLGKDYSECHFSLTVLSSLLNGTICRTTGGIVLTVAAKGFILWFLNFGLALAVRKIGRNIRMNPQGNYINNGPRVYPSIPRIPDRNVIQQPSEPSSFPYAYQTPVISGQTNVQPINQGQPVRPSIYGQSGPQNNYLPPQQTNFGSLNSPNRF